MQGTAVTGRGQRGRGGRREQAAPAPVGRGQTAGRGGESVGPSERRSGRGSRGRRGGRDEVEEERVQRLQTERRVQTEVCFHKRCSEYAKTVINE